MTNTFFAPGTDKLEDMIASVEDGYLLEDYNSGMEDPKNWGIQCMIAKGREIKNGKLTGKLVAPILMTGYVPDLLNSISMVSDGLELSGSGFCGKGHKEWVKTSTGGTYIKCRGRLG
jgi:TldD protein